MFNFTCRTLAKIKVPSLSSPRTSYSRWKKEKRHLVEVASKEGGLNIIRWFKKRKPDPTKVHLQSISRNAAEKGDLAMLKWCLAQGCSIQPETYNLVARSGNCEIMRWLISLDPEIIFESYNENCGVGEAIEYEAAESGNIEMMKLLLEHDPSITMTEGLLEFAAFYGKISMMEWLMDKFSFTLNSEVAYEAARGGQVNVLHWIRDKIPNFEYDIGIMNNAADEGHLHVIQWLRSMNPPCPWNESTCDIIAYHDNLLNLQWVRSQDPPCPWNRRVLLDRAITSPAMRNWIQSQPD